MKCRGIISFKNRGEGSVGRQMRNGWKRTVEKMHRGSFVIVLISGEEYEDPAAKECKVLALKRDQRIGEEKKEESVKNH